MAKFAGAADAGAGGGLGGLVAVSEVPEADVEADADASLCAVDEFDAIVLSDS